MPRGAGIPPPRPPPLAPRSAEIPAHTAVSRARISSARPKVVKGPRGPGLLGVLLLELGGAFRHEAVPLADELSADQRALDDDLASLAERVGDLARVPDRERLGPLAVADAEQERVARVLHGPRGHRAGDLVGLAGLSVVQ